MKEIKELKEEIQDLMAQLQNWRRRSITCWVCGEPGHLRRSPEGNGDVPSRRPHPENNKCYSRVKKQFGIIDQVVRQVTTPLTWELDTWNDESIRKDQLADPEIKPIIELKESSDEKPSWQDIAPLHPITKCYWVLSDSLHMRNNVLY
ncbi:integrase_H2C2 domain-containing protein [Trichonephila clavipes]|nr:integrase_H2C2 domain-containing protein [Trichonephila clavipes]